MELTKSQILDKFWNNRKNYFNLIYSYQLEFDEIIQESCLRILDAHKKEYIFEHENQLYMFLRRIVNHVCVDYYRRKKGIIYDFDFRRLADTTDDFDFRNVLLDFIISNNDLTPLQRTIIQKHYWGGLKYREIAIQLNQLPVSLRKQFFLAKHKLKQTLKQKMEE